VDGDKSAPRVTRARDTLTHSEGGCVMADNNDKPLNPDEEGLSLEEKYNRTLANELHEMHKRFTEEFAGVDSDDPVVANKARAQVIELVPKAAVSISTLILHAESETVRANLSKWVFEVAMKAANEGGTDSELVKLFEELRAKDTA
jgi:hypothetical protein